MLHRIICKKRIKLLHSDPVDVRQCPGVQRIRASYGVTYQIYPVQNREVIICDFVPSTAVHLLAGIMSIEAMEEAIGTEYSHIYL